MNALVSPAVVRTTPRRALLHHPGRRVRLQPGGRRRELPGPRPQQVKEVGHTYGEIDIEALAAAKPDLILTHAYPVDSAGTIDTNQPLYGFAAYPGDGVYIAKAADDPALRSYTEPGLAYPDPGGSRYYWEQVSWENIGKYPTDVVLYSLRAMDKGTLPQQATFARMPAARGRLGVPVGVLVDGLRGQARTLDNLAANLEAFRKVV